MTRGEAFFMGYLMGGATVLIILTVMEFAR